VKLAPQPLLVPWSRKSRGIPLLSLRAVLPVQSLSAQCLYKGALYLNFTSYFLWQISLLGGASTLRITIHVYASSNTPSVLVTLSHVFRQQF